MYKPFLIFYILLILIFSIFVYAQEVLFVWNSYIRFVLPAYNTVIAFAKNAYFTAFRWDSLNASMIYFYNVMLEDDEKPLDFVGIGVMYANATIYSFNESGVMRVILSAPAGTISYLFLDLPQQPQAIRVVYCGREEMFTPEKYISNLDIFLSKEPPAVYNNKSKITIKMLHCSESVVDIFFYSNVSQPAENITMVQSTGTATETRVSENTSSNQNITKIVLLLAGIAAVFVLILIIIVLFVF